MLPLHGSTLSQAQKVRPHDTEPRGITSRNPKTTAKKGSVPESDDQVSLSLPPEEMLREYIYFFKELLRGGREEDFEDLYQKLTKLAHELSGVMSPPGTEETTSNGSEIQQLAAVATIESQQSLELSVATDGETFSFSGEMSFSLSAAVAGEFTTSDGRTVSFQAAVSVQVSLSVQLSVSQGQSTPPVEQADPLALDLNGDGNLSLTSIENGVTFDINGDGVLDQTSFIDGPDAFLAWDRNDNGAIDDGRELFGDQHEAANGFLELAKFDDDGNKRIDAADSIFNELRGVRRGQDGTLELLSLEQLGIQSIDLNYTQLTPAPPVGGARLAQQSSYLTASGQTQSSFDVLLSYRSLTVKA